MTEYEIERILGCTPCVCGDLETWHRECYVGKTKEQLAEGAEKAMRKARAEVKRRQKNAALSAIANCRATGVTA